MKSFLEQNITYRMGAGIHFVVALAEMKNSFHIIELKVDDGAVVVVGLFEVV